MKSYQIIQLDKNKYQNYSILFKYETEYYYDVKTTELGFQLELKMYEKPVKKQFTDELYQDWLEEPVAYGIEEDGKLIALIEGSIEIWHHLFRISNIFVEKEYRRCGLGHQLMTYMIEKAKQDKSCRGIILETQSCNYPAIQFYHKHGFRLARIDVYEYSNHDIENKEVRLDFIYPLEVK